MCSVVQYFLEGSVLQCLLVMSLTRLEMRGGPFSDLTSVRNDMQNRRSWLVHMYWVIGSKDIELTRHVKAETASFR